MNQHEKTSLLIHLNYRRYEIKVDGRFTVVVWSTSLDEIKRVWGDNIQYQQTPLVQYEVTDELIKINGVENDAVFS